MTILPGPGDLGDPCTDADGADVCDVCGEFGEWCSCTPPEIALEDANMVIEKLRKKAKEYKADANTFVEYIEDLLEFIDEPPDKNCSCHIRPPCSDCVEHSKLRELLSNVDVVLKAWKEEQK